MRGAGDHLTVGQRIAFYRGRRGLTQAVLAGLVGRSEDWLSKIERGDRSLRRVDTLSLLAQELRVTLGDLLGQPVLTEDDNDFDDIPAVRRVLMAPRRLSRVLYTTTFEEPPSPQLADEFVNHARSHYQQGDIGRVIAALPGMITTAQRLEDIAPRRQTDARQCWAVSARTHHLASSTLIKVGEADLAWIAAERAMSAADQSDNDLVLAAASRAGVHALMASGRFTEALDFSDRVTSWLWTRMRHDDPAAQSLYGMLNLSAAMAAARNQDRSSSNELLHKAESAAALIGHDADYWQTNFGPTNVKLHRMAAALEMGDVQYVVDKAPQIDASSLSLERQTTHLIDLAKAYSYVGRDDNAIQSLLTAEQGAPTLARTSATVRETVKVVQRRSLRGTQRLADATEMANRCRATG